MKQTGFYLTEDQIKEQVECFRYVRVEERKPIGIVVLDKQGRIGWSLYNDVAEKKAVEETGLFPEIASTDKGLLIALNRAASGVEAEGDVKNRIMTALQYSKVSRLVAIGAVIVAMKKLLIEGAAE